MIVTSSISKAKQICSQHKIKSKIVGFVPTMGALHLGHFSLIRKAKHDCDFLVVSIFVNPFQFGPGEDYGSYPRSMDKDMKLLEREKADLLFCPQSQTMYSSDFSVYVEEIELSKVLCGKSRQNHFRGVCTVVSKLFNIINPDIVYFGQKDYQQALIVKKLVQDLNFSIKIKILPIIREKDNLAMSSRNVYLGTQERGQASCLYQALKLARKYIQDGQENPKFVIDGMKKVIASKPLAMIDYIKIVDPRTLKDKKVITGKVLVALAVYINKKVRLIDNVILKV